jgi:long-chain acyl-CoA synthetase
MDAHSTAAATRRDTVPALFWSTVRERGDMVALREKDLGVWRSITWRDYGERAKHTGLALIALGLERGDCACILSHSNPEWFFCDMAIQGAGGVSVGIYPTDVAAQVEYLVDDCKGRFIFAEDEEQLDKVLEVRDRLPTLEKVIVLDMEGLRDFHDPMVMSFDELLERGRRYAEKYPDLWEERIGEPEADDLAILIYTSGTTGPPKGAMISHRNILFQVDRGERYLPLLDQRHELFLFLPLCHIAARLFGLFYQLGHDIVINFAESPETVPENIREVQPTLFFSVPRIWEKFYSGVAISVKEATALQRWAYRKALGIGYRAAEFELEGLPIPAGVKIMRWLADLLVLRNIKRMIGLDRAVYAGTGAAPIAPDLIKWYMALGLPIREVYGQTENTGLATAAPPDEVKPGSVGKAIYDTELSLSLQGEILLKGPHVFMGYYNNPEKTRETVVDGWLHTGDVGEMDNQGWVRITDRLKDIIITAGGKNITPSEIENQLKFSPYISDSVVIGDKRKYLTCLIMIDYDNVANYAQEHDVPFTDFASLTRAPEIVDLVDEEVEKVNRLFAQVETIKKFNIIDHELDLEDEELTPTMKLKRGFVNKKYETVIEAMYQGA